MSRRIRVATVITRAQAGAGGVALRGALALDPDDFEVTMVAGGGSEVPDPDPGPHATPALPGVVEGDAAVAGAGDADLLAEALSEGLRVVRVPSLVAPISLRRDRAALRVLTGLLAAGEYDVVHTHSAKAGALGRVAAVRAGVPRIVHTFHGFPFHEFQSAPRRGLYVAIERRLGRRTDAFLAVGTQVAAEAMRRRFARPDQIRTIGAAITTVPYAVGTAARGLARRRLGLPLGARIVGTVGRIDYQKAPEHFVEAVAALDRDDVYGIWIGDGPLRNRLESRVRACGLTDRFLVLGHRDDVPALLPALDVFAMASRYEGLPCAVVEAMNAGIPVVSTAVNAVPDVVVPGETGLLVPPASPPMLARAIGYLLDHPGEAARMTANARARLDDRFNPSWLGEVLTQVYQGPARRPVGLRSPACPAPAAPAPSGHRTTQPDQARPA